MSAHTPGPWTYEATPESSNQDYVVRVGRDRTPCHTEDDARLIAAAPELLAALEAVVSMHAMPGGVYRDMIGAMKKAHAALAKARA